MRHFAFAVLFLSAFALQFISCAGNEVKDPLPPVTSLKSEPVSPSDTNKREPALLTRQPVASPSSAKPSTASHTAVPAAAAVIAVSQPAPDKAGNSLWDNNWLPWLLLLIALLVLWKAAEPFRSRYLKKKITARKSGEPAPTGLTEEPFVQGAGTVPLVVLAKKGRWVPVMNLSKSAEKEITVTVFYKDQEHQMHFSPSTTVKKVTAWAAYQCGIFDLNTTEVYLAIQGYSAPLIRTAHIGRFMMREKHHLELDLLTLVKNAPATEAVLTETPELNEDEILVEGAGMTQAVKIAVKPGTPLKEIIHSVARIGNFPPQNAFIFLENESNPLNPNLPPDARHLRDKVHHVHTQIEITVTAFYNGQEHQTRFSPAATVKKVAAWATYQCGIFDLDAAEVYLAIHGYSAPLTGTAHIGRFVEHDKNHLELDVLTFAKVNV